MRLLLDAGADLETRTEAGPMAQMYAATRMEQPIGDTILMLAATYNQHPDVVRMLLEAGADLEAHDTFGLTPLHRAAAHNQNPAITQALVDGGADLEARDRAHWTPLIRAARNNQNPEVLRALLDAGANATITDNDGRRAVDYARDNEHLHGTDAYWQLHDVSFD